MSKEQHNWDDKNLTVKHKVVRNSTEGGACLNRHDGSREQNGKGVLKAVSCNHRWQAFKKALETKATYNWPAYEALSKQKTFAMVVRARSGTRRVQAPNGENKAWDVTAEGHNFRTSCNVPFWHEAHHLVPNNVLKSCIAKVGEGQPLQMVYVKKVRSGLLREKYNLNHKVNMILLPMDEKVARALQLPRHRLTAEHRSHRAYRNHVRDKLKWYLVPVRAAVQKHEGPPADYKACKLEIEALSSLLYDKIIAAGKLMAAGTMKGDALDEIPASHFNKTPTKSNLKGLFKS
ncbi:AHH domain-containing protein [Myxococcus sp. SDU36]|uniref:AHH domain-containing protein n=1 Tax=Myxococcus sp. SDU36 TaxID=2831967 RepID=UPI0025434DE4|nr:AHH domain-containing protein [Myxococcus sp. SDU36]WIG94294.1 AHH domain-containing protein [Myxococcus sp. SDU36]